MSVSLALSCSVALVSVVDVGQGKKCHVSTSLAAREVRAVRHSVANAPEELRLAMGPAACCR